VYLLLNYPWCINEFNFFFISNSINDGIFENNNNKWIYKFVIIFKDNFFFFINSLVFKDGGSSKLPIRLDDWDL